MTNVSNLPLPPEFADEPEWASELDEAIMAGGLLPEVAAHHVPKSRREAEWPMRKLAVLGARAREVKAQAAEWRAPIDAWEADELNRVAGAIEYFTHMLKRFAIAWRRENPKEATIRLPAGEIATTQPKTPKLSIVDEPAVLAWATAHLDGEKYDEVVQQVESVLVSKLKDYVSVQRKLEPFCQVCGVALSFDMTTRATTALHPEGEYDHEPTPVAGWEVLFNGEPVPGVTAELGDVTATVKPAR